MVGLYSDLARLSWQMAQRAGSNFEWHGLWRSLTDGPPWKEHTAVGVMCTLAFTGSLVIFFLLRRAAKKKESAG